MRKITLSTGDEIEIRSLTPKEIRGGRDLGLKYFGPGVNDENYEDHRDYCLACLLADYLTESMNNVDLNAVYFALIKETWGDPGEEKNSPTSGPGAQTGNASITAATAENPNASKE